MMEGYQGKILRVDLSSRRTWEERLDPDTCKKLIGGAGYGAKVLCEEVGPTVGAYQPGNRIIFGLGPLNGTGIPGSGKWTVVTRSGLTGIQADSSCGAHFGVRLKSAGYDALVIHGRSDKPAYILIDSGKATLNDASHLWGRDSFETTDTVVQEVGPPRASVVCIGQAGEKMIGIACLICDKHSFAGRAGIGAVMGSKNLKAIAVRGSKEVKVAHPEEVKSLRRELMKKIRENAFPMRMHGTVGGFCEMNEEGILPIKYWTGDTWSEGAAKIGAPNYTEVLKPKPRACADCSIGCHRYVKPRDPQSAIQWFARGGSGPEWETLGMFGSSCLIDDLDAICVANDICNRAGIDTISAGAFVGFAMECYEKGLINKKRTRVPLKWGDGRALVEVVRQIANKEGYLGELFSEGIVPAARKIGGGSIEFAQHVKGLDIPAHDPRAFHSMAINYATGTRGACHIRGCPEAVERGGTLFPELGYEEAPPRETMEGKEILTAKIQDLYAVFNSLVQCNFMMLAGGYTLTEMLQCLNAVTGWNWTVEDLMKAGERIFQLQRAVCVIYGTSNRDDVLPDRMFEPAKEGGRANMAPVGLEDALKRYYQWRGWDEHGKPTKEKLAELGLIDTVKGLS